MGPNSRIILNECYVICHVAVPSPDPISIISVAICHEGKTIHFGIESRFHEHSVCRILAHFNAILFLLRVWLHHLPWRDSKASHHASRTGNLFQTSLVTKTPHPRESTPEKTPSDIEVRSVLGTTSGMLLWCFGWGAMLIPFTKMFPRVQRYSIRRNSC